MISTEWLLGFIESNACFSIIIKKSRNSVGYQTQADFSIKLPAGEEGTLREIQDFLGIGHVYRTGNEVILKATGLEDIRKIVAFLEPLDFVSLNKREGFENWKKCISIIEAGKHLQKDGLLEIALLRDVMRSKVRWNKKRFCHVRLDIDPCHVYQKEGELPQGCSICWDQKGLKIDVPMRNVGVKNGAGYN